MLSSFQRALGLTVVTLYVIDPLRERALLSTFVESCEPTKF